jgi:hypothetical protein
MSALQTKVEWPNTILRKMEAQLTLVLNPEQVLNCINNNMNKKTLLIFIKIEVKLLTIV